MVYAYDMSGGAPQRTGLLRQVLRLCEGAWGRVVYNGRFDADELWEYRRFVVNVGWFAGPSRGPFAGEPARAFSDLAVLL